MARRVASGLCQQSLTLFTFTCLLFSKLVNEDVEVLFRLVLVSKLGLNSFFCPLL